MIPANKKQDIRDGMVGSQEYSLQAIGKSCRALIMSQRVR